MSIVAALPAWGYIGFRVRREIRGIREDNRSARMRREERKRIGRDELLDVVTRLVARSSQPLECGVAGHGAGHLCLAVSGKVALADLVEVISRRYGPSRNLAMGGYTDPAVDATTGLPLLTPFGKHVVDMRAWAYGSWWIGAGTADSGDGVRRVVLVAERAESVVYGSPADASWVERVVAVTGWVGDRRVRTIDWAAVEQRLGTALPSDYKQLAEIFGHGDFDGFLSLYVPDAGVSSMDIVDHAEYLARDASQEGTHLWRPNDIYPAPGGLLQWAASEQADQFYWLTEGNDPEAWPVLVQEEDPGSWRRFDCSAAEFVFRMLTERGHPYSTARYFDTHWFQRYEP
ncbi:SMI1/KNR4 family protein [Streptomyces sp. NPDC004069]